MFEGGALTRAAPDPRLRRSVVSRLFAFVGELVQVGGPANPARAGELIRWALSKNGR
jgi:hypothetical protein